MGSDANTFGRTDDPATGRIVYRSRFFPGRGVIPGIVLLLFCLFLIVPAARSGSVAGVVVLALLALALAWLLYAMRRKRAVLSADELVVHGTLTTTRVPLATITAVHHQDARGVVTWLAATGQRPFRIYFVTGHRSFVDDVRTRAAGAGARLDAHADLVAAPPRDTRVLFTLI